MTSAFFTPLSGRLIATNGIELFVTESGAGPAVMLIHGLGWTHALWHRVIAALSGRYRVIAGDTRGHGGSAKPPGPYAMEQLAADWLGILDACNVDRCAIVGVSQGGMIALSLAASHPSRVAALGLLGTTSHFSDQAWEGMEERGRIARAMGVRAAAEQTSRSVFSPGFVAENPSLLLEFVENRVSAPMQALAAATASLRGFDVRGRLSRVHCPTLIMHGKADAVIAPENAAETGRALPQAEIVLVDGAGHILPVERPKFVESRLASFLNRHYSLSRMP